MNRLEWPYKDPAPLGVGANSDYSGAVGHESCGEKEHTSFGGKEFKC